MSDHAAESPQSTTRLSADAQDQILSTDTAPANLSEAFEALSRGDLREATLGLLAGVLLPAALALVLLIVAYFFSQWLSRWVGSTVCKRVDQTLGRFAGRCTYYAVLLVALFAIMQLFGFQSTSLAAVLAAAGFAIGLAFQGTLSNFASGILLLVFRPFKVGDIINAAGVLGKVNEIDLFTTTLDTFDNRRLIVPNGAIAGGTIENVTYHPHRRVDVTVGVAYAASLEQTRQVLTECVEALSTMMISGEDRGYKIVLSNLGASSVDWTVRFWAATEDYFKVKEALTSSIKRGLDEHGIEIPFPQMQLHLHETNQNQTRRVDGPSPTLSEPREHPLEPNKKIGKIRPRARSSTE